MSTEIILAVVIAEREVAIAFSNESVITFSEAPDAVVETLHAEKPFLVGAQVISFEKHGSEEEPTGFSLGYRTTCGLNRILSMYRAPIKPQPKLGLFKTFRFVLNKWLKNSIHSLLRLGNRAKECVSSPDFSGKRGLRVFADVFKGLAKRVREVAHSASGKLF